jgi:hypothetical protein
LRVIESNEGCLQHPLFKYGIQTSASRVSRLAIQLADNLKHSGDPVVAGEAQLRAGLQIDEFGTYLLPLETLVDVMDEVLRELAYRFKEDMFKQIEKGRNEAILILVILLIGVLISFFFILETYTAMLRDVILLTQRMVGLLPFETISENDELYQLIQSRVS